MLEQRSFRVKDLQLPNCSLASATLGFRRKRLMGEKSPDKNRKMNADEFSTVIDLNVASLRCY